ncbi:MAG TPA: hypothetical protein VKQ52_20055, partial [Puia sp.]|nr:hypothetical protein [Puia sp.]
MKRALLPLFLLLFIAVELFAQSKRVNGTADYFPPRGEWVHRSPGALGLDSGVLAAAIRFARDNESKAPRDQWLAQAESFGRAEPFDEPMGPMKPRGEPTGLILYKGYIVAEWGEPARVDMTHSVTKSFLSSVIGLAVDQGLIRSV